MVTFYFLTIDPARSEVVELLAIPVFDEAAITRLDIADYTLCIIDYLHHSN